MVNVCVCVLSTKLLLLLILGKKERQLLVGINAGQAHAVARQKFTTIYCVENHNQVLSIMQCLRVEKPLNLDCNGVKHMRIK